LKSRARLGSGYPLREARDARQNLGCRSRPDEGLGLVVANGEILAIVASNAFPLRNVPRRLCLLVISVNQGLSK
jgi:hypothetical protein